MQAPPNSDLYSSQRSNGMWNTSSFPIVLKILRASDVDQRMMSFETIPSFSSLDSLVHKLYDISSNEELQYTYYDTDGDCISVKTNDDLENMFKCTPEGIHPKIIFSSVQPDHGKADDLNLSRISRRTAHTHHHNTSPGRESLRSERTTTSHTMNKSEKTSKSIHSHYGQNQMSKTDHFNPSSSGYNRYSSVPTNPSIRKKALTSTLSYIPSDINLPKHVVFHPKYRVFSNVVQVHPSITSLIPFTPQQVKIGMVDTDRELTSTEKSIKFPEETRVNEKQKKAVLHRIRELRRKNRETRTEKEKTRLISTKSEQMQQLELFTREEYKYLGSEKRIKTMRRLLCELGKERREEATIQRRRRRQQRRERLEKYQMQRMLGAHRTGPLDEDSDESGSNDSETGSHRHERSSLASEDGGSNISELSYSQVSEDTDSDKEHLNEEDMAKLDNHDEISDEDELRDVLIQTLRMKSNEDFFNDQAQVLAQQYKQKKRERTRRTQLIEKEREDYLNVAKDALTESESEETEEESETEPESFSDGFGEEDSIEAQNRHDEMRRERDEEERRGKREESQFNSGEGSSEEEEEIGEEDD